MSGAWTDEQIEAAAKAMYERTGRPWSAVSTDHPVGNDYRDDARAALGAVA